MGHHLTCFIGRPAVLRHLPVAHLRLVALPRGLSFAPMPEDLITGLIGDRDLSADEALDELAKAASRAGPVGRLISDWFGGNGSTDVALWDAGRRFPASQDEMFAALGVVRVLPKPERSAFWRLLFRSSRAPDRPLDAWDSLGLGDWRDTERAYAVAKPVETGEEP